MTAGAVREPDGRAGMCQARSVLPALAICLSIQACSPQIKKESCNGTAIAQAIGPERHLYEMLMLVVPTTVTAAMLREKQGSESDRIFKKAAKSSAKKYAAEWGRNLAQAYDQTLTKPQLWKVCEALNARDEKAFIEAAHDVGPKMQAASSDLLQKAGAETFKDIWPLAVGNDELKTPGKTK